MMIFCPTVIIEGYRFAGEKKACISSQVPVESALPLKHLNREGGIKVTHQSELEDDIKEIFTEVHLMLLRK